LEGGEPGVDGERQFLRFNASALEVQHQLEVVYGEGNVRVSGGPVDEAGSEPYVVRFVGALADQPVKLLLPGGDRVHGKPFNIDGLVRLGLPGECGKGAPDECEGLGAVDEVAHGVGSSGQVVVSAANLGDGETSGEVVLTDRLPAGLKPESVEGAIEGVAGASATAGSAGPLSCTVKGQLVTCVFSGGLPAYDQLEARIGVVGEEDAHTGEVNEVNVSGGGAPRVVLRRPVTVSSTAVPFGLENYALTPEEEGGQPDALAGSHPFQMTTTLAFNDVLGVGGAFPAGLAKDLRFRWPAGLVGNPTAVPRCTLQQFLTPPPPGSNGGNECPVESAVGVSIATYNPVGSAGEGGEAQSRVLTETEALYNLEPSPGEPARFGFSTPVGSVFIDPLVRSGEDYGITVEVHNITQVPGFLRAQTTVWGVPGDQRHDLQRGTGCLRQARGEKELPCQALERAVPPAFLSLPSSCPAVAAQTSVQADSWQAAGVFTTPLSTSLPLLSGCNQLPFTPQITVKPDGSAASTPTGLTVDVHVPQQESLNPHGLAEGDVKDITVTLPEGLTLNAAAGDGLGACSEAQIGYTATSPEGVLQFTPGLGSCPDSSKIANATITTPLLANPLKGAVYLASPQNYASGPRENPFGTLMAVYLVVSDPASGVVIKQAGKVTLSASGQITTTFQNAPQAPFEDAILEFFGGDRAPLATPAHCASYTTSAAFTPWSGAGAALVSSTPFAITSGPNNSACPGETLPFAPTLQAGATNINAGAFTPFTTTIGREDGQQQIQDVQIQMPPGLSGDLTGIPLCTEEQANTATCPQASQIGETIVSVGLGGDPFTVTGGKVYLTEKYEGAPFGLAIVNPAKAGPFVLQEGRPVIVRAKIQVDPHTAQLTVTATSIPHIIEGIPLQIKHVNVLINRPGFTFNPTNCSPLSITAIITSNENTSIPLASPFQTTNCASLQFNPKITVTTTGKTSKANGASLTFKLAYPNTPFGTQADIAKVKVDLPKQLPSRLTTLQKACLATVFETNPAACPPASIIGHAKATVPNIPQPLQGPAYFVSHGNEAFPSLTITLQGYGITIDLVGNTLIHKGITSTTFKQIPDNPLNNFEITLPQGPYSALAANTNLCTPKLKLTIPTALTAQNNTQTHTNTPIHITNCPKHHTHTKHTKKTKHHKK